MYVHLCHNNFAITYCIFGECVNRQQTTDKSNVDLKSRIVGVLSS